MSNFFCGFSNLCMCLVNLPVLFLKRKIIFQASISPFYRFQQLFFSSYDVSSINLRPIYRILPKSNEFYRSKTRQNSVDFDRQYIYRRNILDIFWIVLKSKFLVYIFRIFTAIFLFFWDLKFSIQNRLLTFGFQLIGMQEILITVFN